MSPGDSQRLVKEKSRALTAALRQLLEPMPPPSSTSLSLTSGRQEHGTLHKPEPKLTNKNVWWSAVRNSASSLLPKHAAVAGWKHRALCFLEQEGVQPMPKGRGAEQGDVDGPSGHWEWLQLRSMSSSGVRTENVCVSVQWCDITSEFQFNAGRSTGLRNQSAQVIQHEALCPLASKTLRKKKSPPKQCPDLHGLHFHRLTSTFHCPRPEPNSCPYLDVPQHWVQRVRPTKEPPGGHFTAQPRARTFVNISLLLWKMVARIDMSVYHKKTEMRRLMRASGRIIYCGPSRK